MQEEFSESEGRSSSADQGHSSSGSLRGIYSATEQTELDTNTTSRGTDRIVESMATAADSRSFQPRRSSSSPPRRKKSRDNPITTARVDMASSSGPGEEHSMNEMREGAGGESAQNNSSQHAIVRLSLPSASLAHILGIFI